VSLRTTRIRPSCCTMNSRVVSPGGAVRNNGLVSPFATSCSAGAPGRRGYKWRPTSEIARQGAAEQEYTYAPG